MAHSEYAFVVFADLRGFTSWSAQSAVDPHLQSFMSEFYDLFRVDSLADMKTTFLKPNGDGVMLVRSTGRDHEPLDHVLDSFLQNNLPFIDSRFIELIGRYRQIMRCDIPLQLGYGISAGAVHRLKFALKPRVNLIDFAARPLNVAARLCDFARPSGVVIAQEAFPTWRPQLGQDFEAVELNVRNISTSYSAWVQIPRSSVSREVRQVMLEFHAGIVCYDPAADCVLLAHRKVDRELYPDLWETGGGQMYTEEGLDDAALRIARSEFGVASTVAKEAAFVPFRIPAAHPNRRHIPGVKLLCLFEHNNYLGYRSENQHQEVRVIPLEELLDDSRGRQSS